MNCFTLSSLPGFPTSAVLLSLHLVTILILVCMRIYTCVCVYNYHMSVNCSGITLTKQFACVYM